MSGVIADKYARALFDSAMEEEKLSAVAEGMNSLAALKEAPPDAVLLDILMPRKSGIGVFKEMKNHPDLQKVPVIVITGASQIDPGCTTPGHLTMNGTRMPPSS